MLTFPVEYLHGVYASIARKFGASEEEAEIFARCFSYADLRGKDTQGIAMVPLVYRPLRNGAARFGAPIQVVREGPAFAVVDGGHGTGQIVATRAMEIAIRKAQSAGVGAVWVRNTNDLAMVSNYSMQALAHDFVGVAMTNGNPLVAPWGGRDEIFNTNPYSVAIPAGEELPIVVDSSASALSHGKVIFAARDKKRLPSPVLVGDDGRFTDDPIPFITDVLDRNSPQLGAILPLGHKGFGWVLFVEVFASLMAGMNGSREVPDYPTPERPWAGSFFLMAIDVGALMPIEEFKAKVDDLIRSVKGSRLAEGFDEIVLPGERAAHEEERRRREGVPIREEEWANIVRIAEEIGLELEALPTTA